RRRRRRRLRRPASNAAEAHAWVHADLSPTPAALKLRVGKAPSPAAAMANLTARAPGDAGPGSSKPPPVLNYILSFVLVGLAWGLTTPFIRAAARTHRPRAHPLLERPAVRASRLRRVVLGACFDVADLLRNPRYAVPLLINLTGSVWFFLLIGRAELSLTVPIVNTLAFLFTVLGEWYVEGKVISKDTGIGMALSLAGIALCVHSKT
ncbi:Transmembrane protein, partial [Tolypocladium ophioglossoides CBS 100239]